MQTWWPFLLFTIVTGFPAPESDPNVVAGCIRFLPRDSVSDLEFFPCSRPIPDGITGVCECDVGSVPIAASNHIPVSCGEQCVRLGTTTEVITRGRHAMKKASAHLIAAIPNPPLDASRVLEQARGPVSDICAMFQSCSTFITISSSAEPSLQEFVDWAQSSTNPKFTVETFAPTPGNDESNPTTNGETTLRARMLNAGLQKRGDAQFVVVLDLSGHVDRWDLEGLAHTFGLQVDNNPIFGIQSGPNKRYDFRFILEKRYSKWAVSCSNSIREGDPLRSYYEPIPAYSNKLLYGPTQIVPHSAVTYDMLSPPEEVDSCFGGLAVLRVELLGECKFGMGQSEFHEIGACLIKQHKPVVLNPRQIVYYRS